MNDLQVCWWPIEKPIPYAKSGNCWPPQSVMLQHQRARGNRVERLLRRGFARFFSPGRGDRWSSGGPAEEGHPNRAECAALYRQKAATGLRGRCSERSNVPTEDFRGKKRVMEGVLEPEIEILRQFFAFCIDREWTCKNPAKALKRLRLLEANAVVPYTSEEIVRIIAACDHIGRSIYERLRSRAMVLLMRNTGLRISDVVTLSRDHVHGNHLVKRAVKNGRLLRIELPTDVLRALDMLPLPKAAPQDCRLFFAGGAASTRSLVKGAQRTLSAVFKRAKVAGAHPNRFRHTLASELLGKGEKVEDVANLLGDSPLTIRRHYAKWTPEYQARQDQMIRTIHGTDLAQTEKQATKC